MSEPRPTILTPKLAAIAAQSVVEDLVKDGHIKPEEAGDSVSDIAKHGRQNMDGYELAKTLDDRAYWDCDFQMCEILDGFGWAARAAIEQAQKEWFTRTSPNPPFEIGARVKLRRGETGIIDAIYEHGPAQYCVKIDGDERSEEPTNSRRIVNFEDALPIVEGA
jgi:polyhydroxyalkanoate synthesis regulator phasin